MLSKTLFLTLTVAFAVYTVANASDCSTITVPVSLSCAEIAGIIGLSQKKLKKFNPGIKCGSIQDGQSLCITAGTLPKNLTSTTSSKREMLVDVTDKPSAGPQQTHHQRALQDDGMHWDTAKPGECAFYGVRRFTAPLLNIPSGKNAKETCLKTPISLPGYIDNKLPDDCFSNGIGFWLASTPLSDTYCRPHWGPFDPKGCVDGMGLYNSRLWDIQDNELTWNVMCATTPANINGNEFRNPILPCDRGLFGFSGVWGNWKVPYDKQCTAWGPPTDKGCSTTVIGMRKWTAQTTDAKYDPCTESAVIKNLAFSKPSECDKGARTGTFNIPDTTCAIPACPTNMAWDYKYGMCMSCSWDQTTPPRTITVQQRRAIETGESRLAVLIKRGLHFKAKVAQRRGNTCSPFHVPASDSPIPPLPNDVQLFDAGHRQGPTAQQIAANHTVREAFQRAWERSFPQENGMREAGGWIFAHPQNPTRDFFVLDATTTMDISTGPLFNGLGIRLDEPDAEPAWHPEEFVLVATFHTHPRLQDNQVSEDDNILAWEQGVPGIMIHENGLTAYGPTVRAQITTPGADRYFPKTNEQNPKDNKADEGVPIPGWKPACVPNQPQQAGTSRSFKGCLKHDPSDL